MQEKQGLASERTPLIFNKVVLVPSRHPHPCQPRRTRNVVFYSLRLLALAFFLYCLVSLLPSHKSYEYTPLGIPASTWWTDKIPSQSWLQSERISHKDVQNIMLKTPNETRIEQWSKYYTSGPHLAGKNLSQALWTKKRWEEFGIQNVEIKAYDVYLNYPVDHRLALLETDKHGKTAVKFEATLEEDVLKNDSTSGLQDRVPTFHGYSASGNVTASFVYVNYGTHWDFQDLVERNITLSGKIALIKYGKIFRGLKIREAEELGMIGAVLYSDPGDDGEITEQEGYKHYPNGPARNPSSVQRGSAQFLSYAPGDPTTPGYPSKPGVPRQDTIHAIPRIPSLPISYTDALPLLNALNGHGPKASSINEYWKGGGLKHEGVKYNIGPTPENLTLTLYNEQEYVTTPIWNVIGTIPGTISNEVVAMGNHRDAWIAGGAADPNSGTAAMLELVRGFGEALKAGWKPLRTILLASWDGEEYGLLGSTEWVEDYVPWLNKSTVAYINVDVGAAGPYYRAASAPLLDYTMTKVLDLVKSPNQTVKGQTVADVWDGHISTMGSGSDFTAFQDFVGIPSVDIGFSYGPDTPVYHYHSNYDSFDWMSKYGDPGWHYHATIAKIWGLLAVELADSPIIPFNATNYAKALAGYVEKTEEKAKNSTLIEKGVSFYQLKAAIDVLHNVSLKLDGKAQNLKQQLEDAKGLPWYKWWLKLRLYYSARQINNLYKAFERQFIYEDGLDRRVWYKHTVFAPGRYTGYAGTTFPGMMESIEDGDVGNLYRWQSIISTQVYDVINLLKDVE